MATKFLEPGGDATFNVNGRAISPNGFWYTGSTSTVVTDFVHGAHVKSLRHQPGGANLVTTPNGTLANAGNRVSFYIYIVAYPNATGSIAYYSANSGTNSVVRLRMTSTGVLQLWETSVQIGIDGTTLSLGVWYRISMAHTLASSTVNEFRVFRDGVLDISVTNATITNSTITTFNFGNGSSNATFDARTSDHYVDDSTALTDPGNIWVTAKRPNANGTTNGFTTQIGAGGSGYGSGHSPQVNERALSETNGWSMVGAGSAVTEEYNIESKSTGDIDISTATIVDYVGWISTKSLVGETVNIIVNGVNFSQAITSTITLYTKAAGSATYPARNGTDIGMQTDTSLTTVSLYECGIMVAYIPSTVTNSNFLSFI